MTTRMNQGSGQALKKCGFLSVAIFIWILSPIVNGSASTAMDTKPVRRRVQISRARRPRIGGGDKPRGKEGTMIIVTSLKQPERGAVMALHCSICRVTVFMVNIYAKKPDDGDYWLVQLCPNEILHRVSL